MPLSRLQLSSLETGRLRTGGSEKIPPPSHCLVYDQAAFGLGQRIIDDRVKVYLLGAGDL